MFTQMQTGKSLVGFRFIPTDEELVDHFLMRKILSNTAEENPVIPEIKLCDYEPWELPDKIKKDSNFEAQHFFSPCDYKYKGSLRINRVTKAGFWKPTGKPRKVINKSTKKVIGTKKSLVFYQKQKPKPKRTGYILNEYDTIAKPKGKSNFLLYKLKIDWEDFEIMNANHSEEMHQIPAIDFEYQNQANQNDMLVFKGNSTATKFGYIDTSTAELEGSHVNEGSVAFFDQLEPLVGPEDSFYWELWSPEDCFSGDYAKCCSAQCENGA